MENLAASNFDKHLHWPQGRGKPALLTFADGETKNAITLDFEVPAALADRFFTYRNEIAPNAIGIRPNMVFMGSTGKQRTQAAITVAIEKAVLKHTGVKLTPHQFRHITAKLILDANPGAHELVRQMLGHKHQKTTTNFYAGADTRRAGRAHAALILQLREARMGRRGGRRQSKTKPE
jgi:integrase